MKKTIILILFLFLTCFEVNALTYGGCEYKDVTRMKSMVSNINISYDYVEVNNGVNFSVTITNLRDEIYFYDTVTRKNYYYKDTDNGEITIAGYNGISGGYKFYSANSNCYGISLGTKYYSFPKYNIYYNNKICEGMQNFSFCQKWLNKNISYNELVKYVEDYKKSGKNPDIDEPNNVEVDKGFTNVIGEFYSKYYYYFLIGTIIICLIIILFKRKKDKFDL